MQRGVNDVGSVACWIAREIPSLLEVCAQGLYAGIFSKECTCIVRISPGPAKKMSIPTQILIKVRRTDWVPG